MTSKSLVEQEQTKLIVQLRTQGASLDTTAKVFNISRLKVRQIESKYFQTLREENK